MNVYTCTSVMYDYINLCFSAVLMSDNDCSPQNKDITGEHYIPVCSYNWSYPLITVTDPHSGCLLLYRYCHLLMIYRLHHLLTYVYYQLMLIHRLSPTNADDPVLEVIIDEFYEKGYA